MAINDEFKSADARKVNLGGSFSSQEDLSAAAKLEMGSSSATHSEFAGTFSGRTEASTVDVARKSGAADLTGSSQNMLMGVLAKYAQGAAGTTLEGALESFSGLDETHAMKFLATSTSRMTAGERALFVERFEGAFGSLESRLAKGGAGDNVAELYAGRGLGQTVDRGLPRGAAKTAALAAGDAIFGMDEEGVAGAAWQGARTAQRVKSAIDQRGVVKGGIFSAANAALDTADDDNVIKEGRDIVRAGRRGFQAVKNVKDSNVLNVSAMTAKRKSMAIARAIRAGEAAADLSAATRLKVMLQGAVGSLAHGLSGAAQLIGGFAAPLLPILGLVFLLVLGAGAVVSSFGGLEEDKAVAGLSEVESQVYNFFSDKGLDDLHIAAIMGNMYAESGASPSNLQHVAGPENPCPNEDILAIGPHVSGKAAGLFQWDLGRRYALAQYAVSVGKMWYDVSVQLDFFWDHDEWSGNWGYGQYTKGAFYATDDLATAVKIFCRGWERAGIEHLESRVNAAEGYLEKFKASGSGQEYAAASAAQRRIADLCKSIPSPGAGYCAMWVSRVFAASGQSYPGGNANDMYYAWCTSSDRSQLKVGMIVAVPSHSHDSAGRTYGHVAIYVGDGQVMENIGGINKEGLDEWCAYYGDTHTVKWGWVNGIDLSK